MSDAALYRTIWRWHFYAGLIVAPFLLILSITGAIYPFNDELNDALMPGLQFVQPVERAVPPSRMITAALAAHPGAASRIEMPVAPNRPAKVYVTPDAGDPVQVMVDPGTGRVLGSFVYDRTLVGFADVMHGSLTLGPRGDTIVELAACWALVLIASGLFLWWPRGRRSLAGVVWPRLHLRGRPLWRDLHAVTGVWTVMLIAFLLLTGLPWAVVQGPLIRGAVTAMGIGKASDGFDYAPPASQPPGPTMGDALGRVSWGQERMVMPASDPMHGDHGGGAKADGPDLAAIAGADGIAEAAAARGIGSGYRLYLPTGPTGIYTVLTYPGQPEGQRTLQFDRWSGALIGATDWDRYGVGTKAIELGVQIHMGRYFGLANQLLMLVPCIAIIVLVISGVTMWWHRRPAGRGLGAPKAVSGARVRGAVAILIVSGLLLPLFGASLIVLAGVDRLVALIGRRSAAMA